MQSVFDAIKEGAVTSVKQLYTSKLQLRAAPGRTYDKRGFTPFHAAALYGRVRCLEVLLAVEDSRVKERTALLQRAGKHRNTPLHIAVATGRIECIRLLLESEPYRRSALLVKDRNGNTPVHLAMQHPLAMRVCILSILSETTYYTTALTYRNKRRLTPTEQV